MKISNKKIKFSYFSFYKNALNKKKLLKTLFIVLCFFFSVLGSFIYGIYLNQTNQTINLKWLLRRSSEKDFSFISNTIDSKTKYIDNFSIDIKFKNWEKIRYFREKALINGGIIQEMQEKVPAKIKYNGQNYDVDVSLTGQTIEHVVNPYKWSLSVKVKDNKTIMGMRKFALLVPQARGYLTDWIATEILKSQNMIGLRSDFVEISVNGNDNGLYYLEERFDKRLIENNGFKEGVVFKLNSSGVEPYGLKKISESEELFSKLTLLKRLIQGFLTDEIKAEKIFDLKKLATLYVVTDIVNRKHGGALTNIRFYFNPITNLIEPISREWGFLRKEFQTEASLTIEKPNMNVMYHDDLIKDVVINKLINSFSFEEEYIKQALVLSNVNYLDSLLKNKKNRIDDLLDKVYKENPFYIFPTDLLYDNQNYIRKQILSESQNINVSYKSFKDNNIVLSVSNNIDLPLEIHYLMYNSKAKIFPEKRSMIKSKYRTLTKNQNFSFLFNNDVNSSNFTTDSLEVYYSILGTNKIKKTIVFSKEMTKNDYFNINPSNKKSNIDEFDFLEIDHSSKTIKFVKQKCDISKDLVIPEGYIVSSKPGCKINLTKSAKIISYSPFLFFGNRENPISIFSSDSTGQGLVVFKTNDKSEFSYVNFNGLSNISSFGWNLTGAITFYESQVDFNNCSFVNNLRGDDYLNIVRTNFNILNSTFENTNSDALDSDFCNGFIENVNFFQVGNDAIDVSGTKLSINKVNIVNPGDKGISGGEKSHLIAKNIKIVGGEIAVASKDNSIIDIDGISIDSTKLGYCSFQKKSEFGPGKIIIKNAISKNVETKYLIETGSSLIINGKEIKDKSNKVIEKLYGSEYGKSSK